MKNNLGFINTFCRCNKKIQLISILSIDWYNYTLKVESSI